MGGSGGFSGYREINPKTQMLSSSKGVQASQREIEINDFLEDLLKELNNRDVEAIQKHIGEIQKVLGIEIDGLVKILFGGSISKKTFIEGASDVDALIILDKDRYKNSNPKDIQKHFLEMLQRRFPNNEIIKGELAVTLKFSDYEIQLLPALQDNGKIRIANKDSTKWSAPINIAAFTERLTKTNKINGNKVVPVIKLAKSLFSGMPDGYQLSGYHVEALGVDAFSTYNGRYTLYDMTKHLLNYSVKRILSPMNDVTGQSGTIDGYLGVKNSPDRQLASRYIQDIASRFSGSDAISMTKELIYDGD